MFILLIRTIILYVLVIITLRIMGKRQIGQLQPYELVTTIMISELASLPMGDTRIPLMHGIIPIITLLIIQVCMSLIGLKSEKARIFMDGKPNLIVKNGKLQIPVLRSELLPASDVLEELRIKGYFNLNEIEYAILETNGQISIISKSDFEPVIRKDLNIKSTNPTLPLLLVSEGKKIEDNLKLLNENENWLDQQLRNNNIKNIEELFIAYLDTNNNFVYQYKENNKEEKGEIEL